MEYAHLWAFIPLICSLHAYSGSTGSEPLFLTPMIKQQNYSGARLESKVELFKQVNATAYSGYITVNQTKNFFFLFIEQQENISTAPLLLCTHGGPGISALLDQFLINGPMAFDVSKSMSRRKTTIQNNMSVLYIDAPVGAGFSFTNDNNSYSKTLEDFSDDIVEFLKQFLKVFSEYKTRHIYVFGESYAARFAVALGYNLLISSGKDLQLNFKGTIAGVGFLAPIFYLADSSDFLFQTSMLDKHGYSFFKKKFEEMRRLVQKRDTISAIMMLRKTIFAFPKKKTLFQNLTLYNSHDSALYTEMPPNMAAFYLYGNNKEFKKAMHVGANTPFQYNNPLLLQSFARDTLRNISDLLECLLSNSRTLLYTGQMDTLFPSVKLQAYFNTLNWTGALAYHNASRITWKPYDSYYGAAGYMKKAGKLTSVVLLGMGHYGALDRPDEVYHLLMQFVNGTL